MFVSFKTLLRASWTNFNCKSHVSFCNRVCACVSVCVSLSVLGPAPWLYEQAPDAALLHPWRGRVHRGASIVLSSWQPSPVIGPEIFNFQPTKRIEKWVKISVTQLKTSWVHFANTLHHGCLSLAVIFLFAIQISVIATVEKMTGTEIIKFSHALYHSGWNYTSGDEWKKRKVVQL